MGPKRRRLALSCVACRSRKVKCDRAFPTCVRCQKGGVSCDYVSYTKSTNNNVLPTPSDESPHLQREQSIESWTEDANVWHARSKDHQSARSRGGGEEPSQPSTSQAAAAASSRQPTRTVRELQDKVTELETYVRTAAGGGGGGGGSSRPISFASSAADRYLGMGSRAAGADRDDLRANERALLRGKSFKTQYFGPTHAAGLLLQFEELSKFVKDIITRLPSLENSRDVFKHQRRETPAALILPEFDTLVSLIPDQPRADALVQEYFETFETTYRVLHAPTFFRKYKQFWANSAECSPGFLVQLLLVCASVNCSVGGGPTGFVGRSSAGRHDSLRWIDVCQNWMDLQSQKHMTLDKFQIQVLLTIAKKLNCVKIKREWNVAGHLLRQAMSAGLHREPTFLGTTNISVFDQEMRRRLWFTVLELEVQASLDRGMGPCLSPLDWDCLPPLNLNDEEFDETTEKMPPTRPLTDFTRTSFLCLAQQHLPLRVEMLARLNSVRGQFDGDTAVELDQKLREVLDDLPKWSTSDNNNHPAKAMAQDLSELILYEYLLLIHQPFATLPRQEARHYYSRTARRNAALVTLKIYGGLRQSSAMTLANQRNDIFRAGLAVCHDVSVSSNPREDLMQDRSVAVKLLEATVDLMEDRIQHLGQGFHSYWISSCALGLLYSKMSSSKTQEQFAKETAERVTRLYERLVSQQVAGGIEDATMSTANTLVGMSGSSAQPTPAAIPGQPQLALPDVDPFNMPMPDPFNAFSETLFDFDITDLWNVPGSAQI